MRADNGHPDDIPEESPDGPARSLEPTDQDRAEMQRTRREFSLLERAPGDRAFDFAAFEPGRQIDGKTIAFVFGRHHEFVVYRTSDGLIGWSYPEAPPEAAPIIGEFSRLGALGRAILAPSRRRRRVRSERSSEFEDSAADDPELAYFVSLLGSDLHSALLGVQQGQPRDRVDGEHPLPEPATHFSRAWEMLNQHVDSVARRRHVLAAGGTALAVGAIVAGSIMSGEFEAARPLLLTLAGGTLGSLLSLLPRSGSLGFTPFNTSFQIYSEAALRVVLGALFGLVLGLMMAADLALGPLKASGAGLIVAGIIAGFFERFVPDLLATTVSRETRGDAGDRES